MPKSRVRKKHGSPLDKRRKGAVERQKRRNLEDLARFSDILEEYEKKYTEQTEKEK